MYAYIKNELINNSILIDDSELVAFFKIKH